MTNLGSKPCLTCRHYSANGYMQEFKRCNRTVQQKGINPVTGEPHRPKETRWPWCDIQREDGWFWSLILRTCGKKGHYWEPQL